MFAIDTNILLRIFQNDDPVQTEQARQILREHAPVFVNDIVLVEFAWTCKSVFKLDREAIFLRLKAIVEAPEFCFAYPSAVERAVYGYGSRKSDFADWLAGESNVEHGCETTFTFDDGAAKGGAFRLVD